MTRVESDGAKVRQATNASRDGLVRTPGARSGEVQLCTPGDKVGRASRVASNFVPAAEALVLVPLRCR